jgi:hypothetical protein
MREIQLTQGKTAVVDDDDYENCLAQGKWQARRGWKTWYASTDSFDHCILLHRFVLNIHNVKDPYNRVDHIDRNGLNCCKANLRIVPVSLNHFNREGNQTNNKSGVTGVYWSKQKRKWHAELKYKYKKYHLGFFDTIEEAAAARSKKEKELWQTFTQHP